MKRLFLNILIAASFVSSFCLSSCDGRRDLSPESRPNIIILFADDLGYADLGCQGSQDIRTPHIDCMAGDGLRFTSGYVTAPQCGPSRAGMMTGMNQARFAYLDNKNNRGLPSKEIVPTIAEYLKSQDYVTGLIGKWHIGDEPEYGESLIEGNRPWNRGFDYTLMMNRGMSHYFPYREDGHRWMTTRDREPRLTEVREGGKQVTLKDYPEDSYLTDILSMESVNFIRRHKKDPFFLYVAYNAPHTPLVAKEEDMTANSHIADRQRQTFAAMMTAVDRGVGEIRNELEQLDLDCRTLVFFISDNGGPTSKNTSRNDPLSGVKGDVLEGGIRIPFIACWPEVIPGGQVLNIPVSTIDVLPTSVAISGGELSAELDYAGVNLLPYMRGEKAGPPHEWLVWRWRNKTALRRGDMKITEPGDNLPHSGLYNLGENLKENEGTMLDNPLLQKELEAILDQWNTTMVKSIEIPE